MQSFEHPIATFLFKDTVVVVTLSGTMYQWYRDYKGEWYWRRLSGVIPYD